MQQPRSPVSEQQIAHAADCGLRHPSTLVEGSSFRESETPQSNITSRVISRTSWSGVSTSKTRSRPPALESSTSWNREARRNTQGSRYRKKVARDTLRGLVVYLSKCINARRSLHRLGCSLAIRTFALGAFVAFAAFSGISWAK